MVLLAAAATRETPRMMYWTPFNIRWQYAQYEFREVNISFLSRYVIRTYIIKDSKTLSQKMCEIQQYDILLRI